MKEAAATTNQAFHPPSGFLVISNFFEKCSSLQVLKHLKGRIRYIISPFWIIQSDPVDTRGEKLQFCLKCDDLYDWFSIAKATLQSQMFVHLSVRSSFCSQNPSSRWKSIIHHLHQTQPFLSGCVYRMRRFQQFLEVCFLHENMVKLHA